MWYFKKSCLRSGTGPSVGWISMRVKDAEVFFPAGYWCMKVFPKMVGFPQQTNGYSY